MAATVYEGMHILDSGRYGRDPNGVSGEVKKIVEEAGGKILVSRLWEERRLAYPINGQRKGTYWLTYFEIEGPKLGAIRRRCELSEGILRSLFLKVDSRIVETLVEHAKSGTYVSRAAPAEAAPEKPAVPVVDAIADL